MRENCYVKLSQAVEVAEKRLNGKLLEDNAGTMWDTDNLLEQIKEEELSGEETYYCVGIDGSIGYTKDNGYNVEWIFQAK